MRPEGLRGAVAVASGFLSMLVAVAATLAVAMPLMGVGPQGPVTAAFAVVSVLLSTACGAFGGAVCAWLAGPRNTLAGPVLAVVVAAPGVLGSLHAPPGPSAWHGWAVTAAGVLGVLAGGVLWTPGRRRRA